MRLPVAEVSSGPRPRRKIDARNARGNVVGCEKDAAAHIKIRRHVPASIKIPFEAQRVEAHAVDRAPRLKDDVHGDGIHDIFETSAEKTRAARVGQNPAVAHTEVPCARVRGSIGYGVPTAAPHLKL